MNWIEKLLAGWVVKHRWWILTATVLTVIITSSGVRFLVFSNDTRVFFSKDNPQLQALETLENTYTKNDNVLFAIAPKNNAIFTRETLAAVEELTENAWQIPYSSRVDSITNFQHTRAEGDDLIVENLVRNSRALSDASLEQIQQIALSEPILLNSIISSSGHVTGVQVTILKPGESLEEVEEVASFARAMAHDFKEKYPDIDIYLTGGVMLDDAFGEAGKKDMVSLVPLMLLTLVIIVGLALRSYTGTVVTLVIILFSMATAMGVAGWLGIMLTAASVSAPTIILTLAVADSVHILATVLQQIRSGKSKHAAIAESLRINLQPVFLTSITTAIGFLSMNFSDAPPFRDLGNMVAIGVMAAFLYSILFLPALLAVLPMRAKPETEKTSRFSFDRLAELIINKRRTLFWVMIILTLFLSAGITRIELNDQFVKYFSERYDIRRATDFVEANLTGWDMIEYSLESGEEGGINDPAYLARVDAFANWYRDQPKVVYVSTLTDTMKRLNKNMHGDDETYYRIPGQRTLAAQYLLLYEMSLPFGLDLNNQINVQKSATRMQVILKDVNTRELREMDSKARQWLTDHAPSMFTYGSGLSIIWAHISQRNINSMLGASFWALLLISAILILALRNFKIGMLSLIPNLAPAITAFGLWGLFVGRVGLALSVVVAMTLGIVVDDTVHFLSKYLRARREHTMPPEAAVRYAFRTVGTAMWVTTMALVAGFSVLALSSYKMNADMGLMSALTIIMALGFDFLFLPVLLLKTDRKTPTFEK